MGWRPPLPAWCCGAGRLASPAWLATWWRLPGRRPRIWWKRLRLEGGARVWAWWDIGSHDQCEVGLGRMGFVGCVDAGRWWLSISGRNPVSGLCRIGRRRRPWASCSFLEALLLCGAPPPSPRPWLRRETSDLQDRAMKAPSRLLPPWGHRLGAGHNLETSGWRHLRRVGCGIFAAWFAEAAISGAWISVWQR